MCLELDISYLDIPASKMESTKHRRILFVLYLVSLGTIYSYKLFLIEPVMYKGKMYVQADNFKLKSYEKEKVQKPADDKETPSYPIDVDKMTFAMVDVTEDVKKVVKDPSSISNQIVGFANTSGEYMTATTNYIIMNEETKANANMQMWHPIFYHSTNDYMLELVDISDKSSTENTPPAQPSTSQKGKNDFPKKPLNINKKNSINSSAGSRKCISVALLESTPEFDGLPERRIGLNIKLMTCNEDNIWQRFKMKEIKPIAEDPPNKKTDHPATLQQTQEDQRKMVEAISDVYYKMSIKPLETIARTLMHIINKLNGKPMAPPNKIDILNQRYNPNNPIHPYDPYMNNRQKTFHRDSPGNERYIPNSPSSLGNERYIPPYEMDNYASIRPYNSNNGQLALTGPYNSNNSQSVGPYNSRQSALTGSSVDSGYSGYGYSADPGDKSSSDSPTYLRRSPLDNLTNSIDAERDAFYPRQDPYHLPIRRASIPETGQFDRMSHLGYPPYENTSHNSNNPTTNIHSLIEPRWSPYDWNRKPPHPLSSSDKDISIYPKNPKANNPTVAK